MTTSAGRAGLVERKVDMVPPGCNICCRCARQRTIRCMTDLATRIEQQAGSLPPAERRVAEVVLGDPSVAAFATVAELGRRASTSGATVVRLADRLGYAGWVGLQTAVRAEVDQQFRPAAVRIRERATSDVLSVTATREAANVHGTLDAVDRSQFDEAVGLLADPSRTVRVLAGS